MTDAQPPKMYRCNMCGFTYNERAGMPDDGIAPGTRFADLPEDWTCPDCSSPKAEFEAG